MPSNNFVGHLDKLPVLTVRTLDSRLLADAANPFIGAMWRISSFASFEALKSPWKDVTSSTKKRAEEGDFLLRTGILVNLDDQRIGRFGAMLQNLWANSSHNLRRKSSNLTRKSGGAGVNGLRTCFDQRFQFLIRSDGWEGAALLVRPYSSGLSRELELASRCLDADRHQNPVINAAEWRRFLETSTLFSVSDLAAAQNLTPGRVRQYLRLLQLPTEALEFLRSLRSRADLRHFSEHKLREIVSLPAEYRGDAFQELKQRWELLRSKQCRSCVICVTRAHKTR